MVKRDAHIDVIFRNGLENLEILPPSDIWADIEPVISGRKEAGYLFRIAAGIAALVSLGLLAYFAGIETTSSLADAGFDSSSNNIPVLAETITPGDQGDELFNLVPVKDIKEDLITREEDPVEGNLTSASISPGMMRGIDIASFNSSGDSPGILRNETGVPGELEGTIPENFDYVSLEPVAMAGSTPDEPGKWKVGAQLSPTYLSSNLSAANKSFSELNSDESAMLSYSGGVTVSYSLGSRFSLQAGVYYSSLGREISGISSYSGFQDIAGSKSGRVFGVETKTGTINTTNRDIYLTDVSGTRIQSIYSADNFDPVKADLTPYGGSLQQTFEYLEVPFMLSYKVIDRKIDFNLQGGMSYNFLLENETYALGDNGSKVLVGTTDNVTRMFLSSALGMSFEYSFADRFSLSLGPSFRYYLNSGGRLSTSNPYTMGLYSGFFYKF